MSELSLLSGVNRTSLLRPPTSESDPSETSNLIASEAGWVPFPSRWPAQSARLLVLHKGLSQELLPPSMPL
jgi:hypothetical protein